VRPAKKRIVDISAKNNKENLADPNSILNPLTSSLSPSAKSKGARCVSARIVRIQSQRSGKHKIINGNLESVLS